MVSVEEELELFRREGASAREEREAVSGELVSVRQALARMEHALSTFAVVCDSAANDLVRGDVSYQVATFRMLAALAAVCSGTIAAEAVLR